MLYQLLTLLTLSGDAEECASKARASADGDKAANDILRCQSILEDALDNYIRISKRTVG